MIVRKILEREMPGVSVRVTNGPGQLRLASGDCFVWKRWGGRLPEEAANSLVLEAINELKKLLKNP